MVKFILKHLSGHKIIVALNNFTIVNSAGNCIVGYIYPEALWEIDQ